MTQIDPNNNNHNDINVSVQSDFVLETISVNSSGIAANANHSSSEDGRKVQWKHFFYQEARKYLWTFPLLVAILLPTFTIGA